MNNDDSDNDYDEDELQLLREQEQFLKSNSKPSVTVISRSSTPKVQPPLAEIKEKPKSLFAQRLQKKAEEKPLIITDVIEKDVVLITEKVEETRDFTVSFPKVLHRTQRVNSLGLERDSEKQEKETKITTETKEEKDTQKQKQISAKPLKKLVQKKIENIAKNTTNIKNFFLSNFDENEREKLKWTKIEQLTKKEQIKTKWRFDFEGKIITNDEKYRSELYHHGDDPDQPGYTLDEILLLTQSSVPSQRSIAFNLLSRIIDNCHYNIINPNSLPLFLVIVIFIFKVKLYFVIINVNY